MVWVLKGSNCSREEICECLLDLLDSKGIIIGQKEIIIAALEKYRRGKADFGDYMILSEGQHFGAAKLTSFDKVLCKYNANCLEPNEV
jgi:predicted nucleic-acid-binding protein